MEERGHPGSERVDEILGFWFGRPGEEGYGSPREVWFARDAAFDGEIRSRFSGDYERAAAGELDGWREAPESCLARILLLDQFPRNLFRGDPRSFATDPQARTAAGHAVEQGFDRKLEKVQRWFVYLPFEHSEDLEDQRRSVELFRGLGDDPESQYVTEYAVRHLEVIERFGRFPHRNAVLGRASTPKEETFLREPGSSF